MADYRVPLRDMRFVIHEVLHAGAHYAELGRDDVTPDLIDSILGECAKFTETVVAPTNAPGDEIGLKFDAGVVTTPPGFREAYRQYCEDGWVSLCGDPEYGGQGFPESVSSPIGEMLVSANMSWKMYSGLTESATLALSKHASQSIRDLYLPKMVSGQWSGTMCLTEPHAGTDLGILRTRAEPSADGSYRITGTKIFITSGEHDLAENIVHLVLAKLPGSPEGSKGISLFVVPKFLPKADGSVGERNGVVCGRIEHKLGIAASATCVMNFSDAQGWLVGEPHGGLKCMFTMMNHARLWVGVQGLAQSERAFQASLWYARDRRQGRSARGPVSRDKPADLLIEHADIRRMLMTQKSFIEGGRLLAYFAGQQMDKAAHHPDENERRRATDLLAILTPIVKAFLTDASLECTSLGIQVHGGHGYIRETGVEQFFRDARITPIYEGTNSIQSFDLLGRKVLGSGGHLARLLGGIIGAFCERHAGYDELAEFMPRLTGLLKEWSEATQRVAVAAEKDPEAVGAAAVDYLHLTGYLCLAWCWAKMAAVSIAALKQSPADPDFYRAKIATARYFYARLLPRAEAHLDALEAGSETLMALKPDQFAAA